MAPGTVPKLSPNLVAAAILLLVLALLTVLTG